MAKKNTSTTKDMLQVFFVLAVLSFILTASVKLFNPDASCLEELWCPTGQSWWMFGITQGLFVFIQLVAAIAGTFGTFWLLFRKPYFTFSLVVSGFLFLLAVVNLFVVEPASFQAPFVYPIAVLDVVVGSVFLMKMLSLSRVDWSKTPKKSNLKQMIGYRYFFQKKTPWGLIFWLFAILMAFLLNIGTLATGETDFTGFAWLMGFFIGIYSILFFFGWRGSMAYLAVTENGEMEARMVRGWPRKYFFPIKDIVELKIHWYVFMPDDAEKGDTAATIKEHAREAIKALSPKLKTLEDVLTPKQRKLKTKLGSQLLYWPTQFELLDVNGKTLLKHTINHEDKEEMKFYQELPKAIKISSELKKIQWNVGRNDYWVA